MTRRILFLDIDGVLLASGDPPRAARDLFSRSCRTHLLTLIDRLPDLRIVVTSSYRLGSGYARLLKLWRADELPDRIIDRTPHLGDRGAEIMAWLEEARLEGDPIRYAVLDDQADFLLSSVPADAVLPCRADTGLTKQIATRVAHYLSADGRPAP